MAKYQDRNLDDNMGTMAAPDTAVPSGSADEPDYQDIVKKKAETKTE